MADGVRTGGAERSGYDSDFSPPLPKRLECPICLGAQREPVQTSCGHRFCGECLNSSLRSTQSRCPLDFKYLKKRDIFPDKIAAREVLDLTVDCKYKSDGCEWNGELRNEQDHYAKDCIFQSDECPNCCGIVLPRKDFSERAHMQECPLRTQACDKCLLQLFARNREIIEVHSAACTSTDFVSLSARTKDTQAARGSVVIDLHGSRNNPVVDIAADWDQEVSVDLIPALVLRWLFVEMPATEFYSGILHFTQRSQADMFTRHFTKGPCVGLGKLQDQESRQRAFLVTFDASNNGYFFFVPKDQEQFAISFSRCYANLSQMRKESRPSSVGSSCPTRNFGFQVTQPAEEVSAQQVSAVSQHQQGTPHYAGTEDLLHFVQEPPTEEFPCVRGGVLSNAPAPGARQDVARQHPSSLHTPVAVDNGQPHHSGDDELIVISDGEDDFFGDDVQVIDNMIPDLQPIAQPAPPATQASQVTMPVTPATNQPSMFGPVRRHHPHAPYVPYLTHPCPLRSGHNVYPSPAAMPAAAIPQQQPFVPTSRSLTTLIDTYLGDLSSLSMAAPELINSNLPVLGVGSRS